MKTKGKILLVSLCAALLVSAGAVGTLAFFSDTETVTNTFSVGDIDITLDEKAVNPDGTPDTATSNRVQENDYHLLPSHKYDKDPTVHIQPKSEDCYVFVKVENDLSSIECDKKIGATNPCLHTGENKCSTIAEQMTVNGWKALGNTGVFVLTDEQGNPAIVEKSDAEQNFKVFDNFWIDGDIDNAELAEYETMKDEQGNPTENLIKVTAYAVQADGFDSAQQAWINTFGAENA